jgi:nucleotide-binding universal stress UspA family protein
MFNDLIVGVGDYEAGRDAIALALQLVSGEGRLTLAYVEVVMVKSPDRPVWQIRERQHAMDRLASLREEFRVDAQLVSVDARSVASGLHELAADAHADLLVIGASRRDDYERMSSPTRCARRSRTHRAPSLSRRSATGRAHRS